MVQIGNQADRTIVDVREGGPGNDWKFATIGHESSLTAPSGGGRSVESRFGRGTDGRREFKGTVVTGDPERITFDLSVPLLVEKLLTQVKLADCPLDVRVRFRCGDIRSINNYDAQVVFLDAYNTSRSYSDNLAHDNTNPPAEGLRRTVSLSAAEEIAMKKLAHTALTGTVIDAAINKIIAVGTPGCAGDCGDAVTGEEEFWAAADRDSTDGYLSTPTAKWLYTADGGANWTQRYINVGLQGDAVDIAKAGSLVLVVIPQHGVAYADPTEAKANEDVWTIASGTAGTSPQTVCVLPNGNVLVGCASGVVLESTDGGFTFSTLDNGSATSENLLSSFAVSDNLAWIGGANGALLRYDGSVVALIATGISDDINAVAVPSGNTRRLFFGSSAGNLYRSNNATATTPTFTVKTFTGSGVGSIDDLQFAGLFGNVLFVLQSNAAGASRVYRDLSGGNLGQNVEQIGDYDSPVNSGINSIAVSNEMFAMCVGELQGSYGYIGKLSEQT